MKISLPIDQSLPDIQAGLTSHQNLVIIAAPGAGKTTRVPPALLSVTSKKILMLQPRRIAARASAERIADENHWQLGKEIGYRVRFEDCTSPQSKIIVVTEALLLRELLKDPELSDYGIIILDEFHERNLYSDTGLAAVRELQQLTRPDLKIIIMSATIEPAPLLAYLEPATLVNVPGRTFPVEIIYDQQSQLLNTDRFFIERVTNKVIEAHQATETDKHILVFLPGLSEIQRVHEMLSGKPQLTSKRQLYRLHGSLSLDEQHEVLNSNGAKIILATNVAETSLTIDGVNTVIDSGLARELQNDQRRLFPWLKTTRISRASAEQRKGRAGRQFPGRCYRLWTKLDDQSMPPFAAPDIVTQDLAELILFLCQLGVSDPKSFSWFETPPALNMERASQFLRDLGVIAIKGNILELTAKGRWIQKLPLPPRLASLVHAGVEQKQTTLAVQMAALLNERDPWARDDLDSWLSSCQDSDLLPRISALNQKSPPREFQVVDRLARQLSRTLASNYQLKELVTAKDITELLLSTFTDRLARRRRPKDKSALVVGQKGIELSPRSLVRDSEFFFCLSGHANESNGNAIVDLAHPISKGHLLTAFESEISLQQEAKFFPEKDAWMSVEQKVFRDLPLEEPSYKPLTLNSETLTTIAHQSFAEWKTSLPELTQWFLRLQLAQQLWPTLGGEPTPWPDLATWEKETVEMACLGENSLQVVRDKKWSDLFCLALPRPLQTLIASELPESLNSPRGRKINLIYEPNGLVSAELKIQEAFGWKETPKIAQGKIKVRLILLGPHMRPLQTTDDLASFWKGTYQELRPSLKARYHRHQWPEDPVEGVTTPPAGNDKK